MNLERFEEFTFTDNLCQAYANYQPSATVDAKQQTQYLKTRLNLYLNRVNELRTSYFVQNETPEEERVLIKTIQEAFIGYFSAHNECKRLDFDGAGYQKASRTLDFTEESLLEHLQKHKNNTSEAFKIINYMSYMQVSFFGDIKSEWDIRVRRTFLVHVETMDDQNFEVLLFYISLMARGILFLHKHIGDKPKNQNWGIDQSIAFCVIFAEALNEDRFIVSTIMPERVPVCAHDNESLVQFNYRQHIIINDLVDLNYLRVNRKTYYDTHKLEIREDPDKFQCFQYMNANFRRDAPLNELQIAVQYKHIFQGDIISYYIRPLKIFKWMLKEQPISSFLFNSTTRRWVYFHTETNQQVAQKQVQVETKVMQQMDNEKQTKQLVRILDLMPTLNIKLSQLQKNVVSSNQNLLCLGRSGTGKTTTSILRLFAQEILYAILRRHHENQLNKKKEEEKQKFLDKGKDTEMTQDLTDDQKAEQAQKKEKKPLIESQDLEKNTGMKMVFITASPVLTTEVRRFYGSIKAKLIAHLKGKEQVRAQAQLKSEGGAFQDITEEEAIEIIDEAVEEEQKENQQKVIEDHEMQEMLDFIRKEEKDLMDDLNIEGQLQVPNSYDDLQSWHFPLFVTVKRLIYMLDACLNYSFFSRDHNNNIIGLESNLGWHNESKGVMMINHYYKENIDYDEQIAKFGKELLEMDKEAEIDDNFVDDSDARNFIMINEQNKQQQQQKSVPGPSSKYVGYYHNRAHERYHLERQQLSFEVDYDTFESKFWPKIGSRKNMKKISPSLVWTEIYSTIKGGMKSCQYYMGYLPRNIYIKDEGSDFLYLNEKKAIYYIFLEYEKWKAEQRAYDFMDVVNHIQKRLWYGETMKKMKMDYLMVDEVQDLTPKTLQILLKLTSHNVFFAGDTAQTIAKGVGARFLDLRHLFTDLDFNVPKIVQLTKNYRSHGKILDLANSVVGLIELFFPKTIDKLVKEESDKDGMKPLVIMPLDGRLMRALFTGTTMTSDKESTLAAPQFGCNQVLIVRDQAAKDLIPDIFKNMLVLSVYEAKGLEFDDVILYNFFHLGDIAKSEWKLLNDIIYEEVRRVKYAQEILDFDCLDVENFEAIMKKIKEQEKNQEQEEYEEDLQLSVGRHRDEVYRKFSMLCIELKFLYVAITRPKRRLIIYDDVAEGRKPIQNYWEKLGVIDVVTKDMIQQPEQLDENVKSIFMSGALQKDRSSQDEWRIQGIKLFKKKYYDAAMKCFHNSNDDELVKRCMAYQEADLGQSKMGEADNKSWRAKVLKHLNKIDKKKLIREAKKERMIAKRHFQSAGALFESIQMLKHAASCFFTGQDYDKAAQIFEQLGHYGQAAECYMEIDELKKAAKLYEKANLITKSIECYEASGEWEQLLHCLHRNKEFFRQEERQSLINKYVPVALNSLYKLYSQEDEDNELDEENKGKMQEMKIKLKYQKKVDVIAEEDEDQDDEDEETIREGNIDDNENQVDEETEQDAQEVKEDQEKRGNSSDREEEIELIEEGDEIPDILNDIFQLKQRQQSIKEEEEQKQEQEQQKKEKEAGGDDSFEIIDTTQVNKQKEDNNKKDKEETEDPNAMIDDFEHLSQYDPEDEFLRSSKSVSIIESILSKKSISQTSDFSIISSAQGKKVNSIISMSSYKSKNTIAFVESNRDIYAEDVITQKIIYYVSLFSDDVSAHLKNIRSKKMLHSNNASEAKKEEHVKEDDFMIDLDDVDSDFVNLILDVLEYYELFRLCLMICNRYHMSERLGRYIISVCSKYSNLHNHRFNLTLLKNNHLNMIWKEKQRFASIIAHEAIHNVFTLIEPKFLSLKDINEKLTSDNSLGSETYRMMLDLGFWKKLVYIHNGYNGLQICYKFFDKTNFDILMETLDINEKLGSKYDNIKKWQNQLVYREFLSKVQGYTRDEQNFDPNKDALKEIVKEHLDNAQISDIAKVQQWMFLPFKNFEEKVKHIKKITIQQEEIMKIKIQRDIEKRMDSIYNIYEKNVMKNTVRPFDKYLFTYQFALLPNTQYYSKVLQNLRYYFDAPSLEQMINLLSQAVDVLNLEKCTGPSDIITDALYSTFLLSNLSDDIQGDDEQSIFKHYKHNYVIMNANSVLLKDVLQIQQAIDAVQTNEFIAQKLVELRPKYFMVNNFRSAFIKQYKDFVNQFHQKHAFFFEKSETAFVLDMDAQYLMVPKAWITKLLIIKLLNVCLSLAQEVRTITLNEMQELESSGKQLTNEEQLKYKMKEVKIYGKINRQAQLSYQIHNAFAKNIENQQKQLKANLSRKEDFKDLLNTYWQQFNLSSISFYHLQNYSDKAAPYFSFINDKQQIKFDLGLCIKNQNLSEARGELIQQGIKWFKDAVTLTEQSKIVANSDSLEQVVLEYLLQSFSYFIFVDQYELFVELIKAHLKTLKHTDATGKKIKWMLQKFMIAVDVHVYLKYGCLQGAAESILQFNKAFHDILTLPQQVQLLEKAFYLVLIGKFGTVYCPDYIVKILDAQYNNYSEYDKEQVYNYQQQRLEYGPGYEGDDFTLDQEERPLIKRVLQGQQIEKITKDSLYFDTLKQINKMIQCLSEDEQSAVFKVQYICLFNMLMSALVNDPKKHSTVIDYLSEGFDLIANSTYDDHFNHHGLMEFEYHNGTGLNDLYKQFKECEDEYKYQFFASYTYGFYPLHMGGYYIAQIDARKCQTEEAQKQLNVNLNKSFYTEAKTIASHLYLSTKIKKALKQKRSQFFQRQKLKTYSYEDRVYSKEIDLQQLLLIDQLPGTQVLNQLKDQLKKQVMLRQMITAKYATNSLDIHYILAKAIEMQQVNDTLYKYVRDFLREKGGILSEFVDLQNKDENSIDEKLNETRKQYQEINHEINQWMNQKAEPNLVEVERKSTKYKIKWESLKLFEKKERLLAVMRKKQQILQSK